MNFLGKVKRRLKGQSDTTPGGVVSLGLDARNGGTTHEDVMHRILGVCHLAGILWHEEKVSYRNGATEMHRFTDVRPAGSTKDPNAEDAGRSAVVVTPQYVKYGLYVNPMVLPRLKGMGPQFAYALNVPHVSVKVEGNIVYVRIPRQDAGDTVLTYEAAWALVPDMEILTLLLGQMEDGTQAAINMEENVHVAVIGMTRSGKTTLLRTMIISAEMIGGAKVVLLDPVGKGFWPLSGHPSVEFGGMFRDPQQIEACLRVLAERVQNNEDQGTTYVFVDEVPLLVRQDKRIAEHLGVIAGSGRQVDMHLVLGAQTALVAALGQATIRNIGATLCGKVRTVQDAYSATGQSGTGAHTLRGRGDFVAVTPAGLFHFQAAMPSDRALNAKAGRDEDGFIEKWAQQFTPRYGVLPAQKETVPNFVQPAKAVEPPKGVQPAKAGHRTVQAVAPLRAGQTVIGSGDPGRPEEDPSPRTIWWAAEQWKKRGKPPALSAIYAATKTWYPKQGGYGRPKAARAIEAAVAQLPAEMQSDAARVAAEIVARYN